MMMTLKKNLKGSFPTFIQTFIMYIFFACVALVLKIKNRHPLLTTLLKKIHKANHILKLFKIHNYSSLYMTYVYGLKKKLAISCHVKCTPGNKDTKKADGFIHFFEWRCNAWVSFSLLSFDEDFNLMKNGSNLI